MNRAGSLPDAICESRRHETPLRSSAALLQSTESTPHFNYKSADDKQVPQPLQLPRLEKTANNRTGDSLPVIRMSVFQIMSADVTMRPAAADIAA